MIFIVMRDEGLRSDGYYYESKTTILGVRETEEEAVELLKQITEKLHPGEKPIAGEYNRIGDTKRQYDYGVELYDIFWVKSVIVGDVGDQILEGENKRE